MNKILYQICSRCIMDTSDEFIQFNEDGHCNHCVDYFKESEEVLFDSTIREEELNKIVNLLKSTGKRKKYDCIFGISGGVDSTYLAYKLKEFGLRPIAVHVDNGWNSELAVKNIEKTLNKLDIDLYTYVLDWEEFKDLQLSFLKASTPDSEVPTDYAIAAVLKKVASKFNVKYIITGNNIVTELIMGSNWSQGHRDWRYIKSVQKIFGSKKLKTYPHYNLFQFIYYVYFKRQRIIKLLNYVDYNKEKAMDLIQSKLGWKYYGGKHYESIYTRFYQGYILPKKFNYDKRRAHFSTLIVSGQMKRQDALDEMLKDPYPSKEMLQEDMDYLKKKFNLTDVEFDTIILSKPKSYFDYPNNSNYLVYKLFKRIYWFLLNRNFIKKIQI